MKLDSRDVILARLRRELDNVEKVGLGEGIPRLVEPFLPAGTRAVAIPSNGGGPVEPVDVAVVEALEVSHQGDLVLPSPMNGALEAKRWIVATLHSRDDGQPKLVRDCHLPVSLPHCVTLVITELGVIEIGAVGLVLREVAPGVATDEVKLKTRASLHVADDIRLMEL